MQVKAAFKVSWTVEFVDWSDSFLCAVPVPCEDTSLHSQDPALAVLEPLMMMKSSEHESIDLPTMPTTNISEYNLVSAVLFRISSC